MFEVFMEKADRFQRAHPCAFQALLGACLVGTASLAAGGPPEGWGTMPRVGAAGFIGLFSLPPSGVATFRGWKRAGWSGRLGALICEVACVLVGLTAGPQVGVVMYFLLLAVTYYVSDALRAWADEQDRRGTNAECMVE